MRGEGGGGDLIFNGLSSCRQSDIFGNVYYAWKQKFVSLTCIKIRIRFKSLRRSKGHTDSQR